MHSKYIPIKSCLQSAWIRAVQDPKFPAWYHPGLIKFPVWYHPGRFSFPAWYHPAFSTIVFYIFCWNDPVSTWFIGRPSGKPRYQAGTSQSSRCLTTLQRENQAEIQRESKRIQARNLGRGQGEDFRTGFQERIPREESRKGIWEKISR